jgi:hypothetical protein
MAHDVLTHAASHRQWADVDLAPAGPTLRVRQGRVAVTGGSVVDDPKSQRSHAAARVIEPHGLTLTTHC